MIVLLFFLSLFGWAYLWQTASPDTRPGAALLCAFCAMCALSYTGVILLNDFAVTPALVLYGGFAAFPLSMAARRLWRRGQPLFRNFFTPAIAIYIFFAVLMTFLIKDAKLQWHDDYSFWARAPRELYLFEKNYITSDSTMGHMDYIPLFASLQYVIVKGLGWSDTALYAVIIACYLTVIAALCDLLDDKRPYVKFLFALFTLLIIPCCHSKFAPSYLSSDGPLALLLSGGLLLFYYRGKNSWAALLPVGMVLLILPGIKIYVGLLFAAMLLVPMIAYAVRKAKKGWAKEQKRAYLKKLAAFALMTLFIQLSWSGYSNYHMALKDYDERAKQSEYLGQEPLKEPAPVFSPSMLFKGNERNESIRHGSMTNLAMYGGDALERLFTYPSSSGYMPFWLFAVLSVGFFVLLCALPSEARLMKARFGKVTALTSVIYLIGFVLTLTIQPDAATSANRYVAVLLLILWMGTLFFLCRASQAADRRLFIAGAAAFVLFLGVFTNQQKTLADYVGSSEGYDKAVAAQTFLDGCEPLLAPVDQDARILIVNLELPDMDTGDYYAYSYLALPRPVELAYVLNRAELDQKVIDFRADYLLICGREPSLYSVSVSEGRPVYQQ